MKVSDRLDDLERLIEELKEKYCENCQQFDCDMCPHQIEDGGVE